MRFQQPGNLIASLSHCEIIYFMMGFAPFNPSYDFVFASSSSSIAWMRATGVSLS
jgi:hypothetical protein